MILRLGSLALALGALEELIEDGGFPASTDDTDGGFHGTQFWELSHAYLVSNCIPSCVQV